MRTLETSKQTQGLWVAMEPEKGKGESRYSMRSYQQWLVCASRARPDTHTLSFTTTLCKRNGGDWPSVELC